VQPHVAVIGAGAAGLMAAVHAARGGAAVTLLERTADGGRKILISGGGRCNVLPADLDPSRFVTASSVHSLRNILRSWPLAAMRDFFERDAALPLVLEPETGKLFPVANRSRAVRDALRDLVVRSGATILSRHEVTDLVPGPDGWRVLGANAGPLDCHAVIVATGGLSVPATGSDGFGLKLLARLGHTVHPTYPALTPLTADPPPLADLAGVSLPARIEAASDTERREATGGFLFTHRGYSGPALLDVSHVAVRGRLAGRPRAELRVAWLAHDARWWRERLAPGPQQVATVVRRELPSRLADRLLAIADVQGATSLSQLTREARTRLLEVLTTFPLPWTSDEGYRKAEVTGGGVALGEVHPATLESRKHPGLFLAGELLDAFGPIGGYNFTWAWVTGRLAGLGAASLADR
jgi:predicted Rossmann fold flavoprotein